MRRLILRPGAIGDCILALPAIEYLAYSSAYSEVWISSAVVPLVQVASKVRSLASTGIDWVGIDDRPVSPELSRALGSFDQLVSWYGTKRPEFREAVSQFIPSCRFLEALPPGSYDGYAADFFAGQVGAPSGKSPKIQVEGWVPRQSVVVHPFSGGTKKNWPLANFRLLAERLALPVEWLAGPEEDMAGARRITDLLELARWLRGAALYIGNDSGITHLAAAIGMPVLTLFGPTDPTTWAPRGPNVTVLHSADLASLGVEQVARTANRLLG